MFYSASVYFIRFYILILCTTYFCYSGSVTWINNFPGNVTRYKRQANCGQKQIKCDSGECLPEETFCDGKEDCRDGSDENSCQDIPCTRHLFRCNYGACISKDLECDGKKDCKDNSDETSPNCQTKDSSCGRSEFHCDSGECIDEGVLCDGKPDCRDNSDETQKHCSTLPCPRATFRCTYGACVGKKAKCDGVKDCFDGSDEASCPNITVTPSSVTSSPEPPKPPPPGYCAMPSNPPNGVYKIGEYGPGYYKPGDHLIPWSILTTVCNRGYKPTPPDGGPASFCSNGKWAPSPPGCAPSCEKVSSTKTTKVTCIFEGRELNSCENPVENTLATIECEPLHEEPSLVQRPHRKCRDGSWDHPFPYCYPICGIKRPEGITNIIGGQNVTQGDYPWHVGIYRSHNKEHICGGSILNEQVILSAAHCFADLSNGNKYPKENYLVAAGKYYRTYDDPRDEKAQYATLQDIHIPTRYRGSITLQEADIAVVVLAEKLTFSVAVQPVCVDWNTAFEYQQISGNNFGVVVGWGQTVEGSAPSEVLKELKIPVIPYEQCFEQVPKQFRMFLTHDKVCAGYLGNGTAACQGDSGGGLAFPDKNDRYYIRGVVSTSPANRVGACDANQYATYTLVSKYLDFVRQYGL